MKRHEPTQLNGFLDTLPRVRFGSLAREVPVFRSCGVIGYYFAIAATLGSAFLGGRSVLTAAVLAALSALSFFVYALLRKLISGREDLVLLEHVWFTLACSGAAAIWLGDIAGALDPVAVGLAFFLAFGRLGCALVGCCHGRPSSVGLVYGEQHAAEGFPPHLVGIRLFPVQLLESVGLLAIGISGLAAMPFAKPGTVLAWFLLSYATMRFGLEALRGDRRPHLLGLSQARWMAIAEVASVLVWLERTRLVARDPRALVSCAVLAGTLVLALVLRRALDRRPRLLAKSHCDELRSIFEDLAANATSTPQLRTSSLGVSLALSRAGGLDTHAHVSLAVPPALRDLGLACELAAAVVPNIDVDCAALGDTAIHLRTTLSSITAPRVPGVAETLCSVLLRGAQQSTPAPAKDPSTPLHTPEPGHAIGSDEVTKPRPRSWYFGSGDLQPHNDTTL